MGKFIIDSEATLNAVLERIKVSENNSPIFLDFVTGKYVLDTVELPRGQHKFVYINGNGSHITFKKGAKGFRSVPANQKVALNEFMATRYLIENFSQIVGGEIGINIGATFNTIINNIEFVGQQEAAIDIRFGLMTKISNVLVTNPMYDGIRLGIGDWSGAGRTNSQSNHSVLEQCRVYSRAGGHYSYDIQNSSGIVIRNCIAEGRQNLRAINFEAYGNPVVKNFTIENFHLEYCPSDTGIYIASSSKTSNVIDKLYVNNGSIKFPITCAYNTPIQLKNIGWWKSSFAIRCTHHAPRIFIEQCTNLINSRSIITTAGKPLFTKYIHITNPIGP